LYNEANVDSLIELQLDLKFITIRQCSFEGLKTKLYWYQCRMWR